jgi:prepilin-type processing-associated H-X9-DG protein
LNCINDFLAPNPFGAPQLNFSKLTSIPSTSETLHLTETCGDYLGSDHFHFADASSGGYTILSFQSQVAVTVHYGGANYLYADGHVAYLSWTKAKGLLPPSLTRFVQPNNQIQFPMENNHLTTLTAAVFLLANSCWLQPHDHMPAGATTSTPGATLQYAPAG